MNLDELTFANRQLADMLKSGIPLEGSLHQLCSSMDRGKLRGEFQALEKDLTRGTPLEEALEKRKLPEFYVQMIKVGVKSNNLPAVLTMLADYYSRVNDLQTRLKGLLVYPAMILVVMVIISLGVAYVGHDIIAEIFMADPETHDVMSATFNNPTSAALRWAPVLLIVLLSLGFFTCLASAKIRRVLRWKLPGFREASLSQIASSMNVMLQGGCTLDDSLQFIQQMEKHNPAGAELAEWHKRLSSGRGKIREIARPGKVFPLEFIWMLGNSEENLAAGFERIAELFYEREQQRVRHFLVGFVPMATVVLGIVIIMQLLPIMQGAVIMMDQLGL